MTRLTQSKKTLSFFLAKYTIHILILCLLTITVSTYAIRYFLLAQSSCITQEQINIDSRCLYILNNKVYEIGSRNSPHKNHRCGLNVTSIIPSSHERNPGNYLLPNFIGDFCTESPTPTPTNTPTPTIPHTTTPTPTPTNLPSPTQTPTPTTPTINSSPTNTPTPTATVNVSSSQTPTPTVMITLLSPTPTPTFIKVGAPLAPTKTPTPTVKILANASPLIQSSITIQPTITFSSAGNITSFGKLLPNKPTNTNNLAFGTTPNIPTSSSGSELPSWEKTGKISSYLAYIGLGSLFLNFLLISYLIISHLKNKGVQNGFMIDLGRKFISNLGLIVSIILTTIPLFIWYYLDPIATRISSSYMIFTSLGQIFGLGGMVLFALSLIYSARFKFLEKYFGGINVLYKYHHQLGGIAFIFLMLHPLFLAATYAFSSIKSAALFLLPGNDFSINLGILSLMLLMLLLILTFFLKLRYQFWHFTHKFLGLAFFLGGMHAFFVKSDISRDPTLKIYMLIIILSALFCFLYKTVFGRFLIKKLPYAVKEIKPLNSQVYEIVCEPINEKIDFRPGQFVFIGFEDSPLGNEAHPFSISSSPEEQDLRLAIKALGDYTSRLNALTPGTIAKIEGPFGQFSYINAKFKKQIWIAGGIGITPFISMAKSLPDDYEIDLYYTVNEQSEAVYLRDLIDIAAKKPHLLIIPHYSKTQTRLTAEQILEKSRDIFHKDIFLCGPPSMMDGLKKQFVEMRVLQNNIHSEEFAFYA